jgi:hypothetical protein
VQRLKIEVIYCPRPGHCDAVLLQLPDGATLSDALLASGLLQRHTLPAQGIEAGVWGRKLPPETPLREGDRVELYRPLRVDPKEARRLRYKRGKPVKLRTPPA